MLKKVSVTFALLMLAGCARTPKNVVDDVGKEIGAGNLKSIQYSGSGYIYAIGQSYQPNDRYSKFNLKSYTRLMDYDKGALREEDVRTQFENPPRGGGVQPVIGERRAVAFLSGDSAWNAGANGVPAPAAAAVDERQVQLAMTPHGWVKAAAAAENPTMESKTEDGKPMTVVTFTLKGKYKVSGFVDGQNQLAKVDTWLPNPVLGDMLVETTYSDYKDFAGVKFPTKIVQTQGGFPVLELTVSDVQPNAAPNIEVPEAVRSAPPPAVRVESQKLGDGVWFLAGGTHNSVLVAFKDYVAVIEGPLDEGRSLAVIAEVKKLAPNKPIRYLINSHHHFDHSGGIRTYVAEGATIITHEMNRPYYEKTLAMPRTLSPDALSKNPKEAKFETVTDKYVLTDGARRLELYAVQGNGHNAGLLIAYLPKEKVLIEPDLFNPPPPNTPLPPAVSPYTASLQETIKRLKLDVRQIAPLHGRVVPVAELQKALTARKKT
jgi:glyoxylase-like metal-dependent hydrolase (beta-lactamase superfamily II)